MSEITSRPYHLGPGACEKCVFGSGEHSINCMFEKMDRWITTAHALTPVTFGVFTVPIWKKRKPCENS
jgi:hypothetical protein